MHFTLAFAILGAAPALISALGVEGDDIPAACAQLCSPLVQLSAVCDQDDDVVGDAQEEVLEADCICNNGQIDVASVTADCAACVGENAVDLDDLEGEISRYFLCSSTVFVVLTTLIDIQEVILACGF